MTRQYMNKNYINIDGKDYAPIHVGFGECCLNCDLMQKDCWFQCQEMRDSECETVALKLVRHQAPPTFIERIWKGLKDLFAPIESDQPF